VVGVELVVELLEKLLVVVLVDSGCVVEVDESMLGIDVVVVGALLVVDVLLMVLDVELVVSGTILMSFMTISLSGTYTPTESNLYPRFVADMVKVPSGWPEIKYSPPFRLLVFQLMLVSISTPISGDSVLLSITRPLIDPPPIAPGMYTRRSYLVSSPTAGD
jgi:hypothetical protein